MATEYSIDIPFTASHRQQAFKLLELPPELLTALESANPPTLTITSSPPTATTPGYALLCTSANQKYQMRQKNTSNPIMVLTSSSTGPTEADDKDAFISRPSVTSIANIEDTIELVLEEAEGVKKTTPKVNKWHEKFAKSRVDKKV